VFGGEYRKRVFLTKRYVGTRKVKILFTNIYRLKLPLSLAQNRPVNSFLNFDVLSYLFQKEIKMNINTSKKTNRGILLIVYLLGLVVGCLVVIGGVTYIVNDDNTLSPAPVNANNYMTNLPSYNPTNTQTQTQ
jgi:hypothetical protein